MPYSAWRAEWGQSPDPGPEVRRGEWRPGPQVRLTLSKPGPHAEPGPQEEERAHHELFGRRLAGRHAPDQAAGPAPQGRTAGPPPRHQQSDDCLLYTSPSPRDGL